MIVQVCPGLFVGNDASVETARDRGYSIVHAAKEPWHREFVGYEEKAAPKDDPEYLYARRKDELALNLVDSRDPDYIPKKVIDTALEFITEQLDAGNKVYLHCNHGHSRSPSIALLWMHRYELLPRSLDGAIRKFRKLYPEYSPGLGMLGYLKRHWDS